MGLNFRKYGLPWLTAFFLIGCVVMMVELIRYNQTNLREENQKKPVREILPASLESSGKRIFIFDQTILLTPDRPFSPGLAMPFRDLLPGENRWIGMTGEVRGTQPADSLIVNLVTTCNRAGVNYKYQAVVAGKKPREQGGWISMMADYRVPDGADPEDLLQAYFWNNGPIPVEVRNIEIVIYSDQTNTP
jgi:hypothetical protein